MSAQLLALPAVLGGMVWSVVSPPRCLHGQDIRFGPLCCRLCGDCRCSPPLSWWLGWPEEASTAALWHLSLAPFLLASHYCWLHPTRTCCLETNMSCFVLTCRKTQLCTWGGWASPGAVHPVQPQSQASSSAPCWLPVAPLPPQPALSPRWASSAHCVGRSREKPPWPPFPGGEGCGASKATRPSLPLPVTAEVTRCIRGGGPASRACPFLSPWPGTQPHSLGGRHRGEAVRGQGLQKMVPCRVRSLCAACVQIFCLPELESRYSQTERLERQLHGTQGRAAAWPTQSGDQLISTQAGAHNSHSPFKGARWDGGIVTHCIVSLKDLIRATSNYVASLGPFEMKKLAYASWIHNRLIFLFNEAFASPLPGLWSLIQTPPPPPPPHVGFRSLGKPLPGRPQGHSSCQTATAPCHARLGSLGGQKRIWGQEECDNSRKCLCWSYLYFPGTELMDERLGADHCRVCATVKGGLCLICYDSESRATFTLTCQSTGLSVSQKTLSFHSRSVINLRVSQLSGNLGCLKIFLKINFEFIYVAQSTWFPSFITRRNLRGINLTLGCLFKKSQFNFFRLLRSHFFFMQNSWHNILKLCIVPRCVTLCKWKFMCFNV